MVSNKLLVEYNKSCNIPLFIAIINKLQIENRLVLIKNKTLSDFKKKYISKKVEKKMKSNYQDRNHIPLVLLSERKIAITMDENFTHDIKLIPGFVPIVASSFDDVDYINI